MPPAEIMATMPQASGRMAEPSVAVPSAVLAAEIADLEATQAGLHDAVSRTALASYASRDDANLRREADQALASLRDASDRLQQLTGAVSLAERQEAEQAAAAAQAERQQAKDKLVAEHERIGDRYLKLEAKIAEDQAVLDQAELDADVLADEWRNANVKVEVYRERVSNDTRRLDALAEQHAVLDRELAALPITAAEVAAVEQAQRDAETAAADEAQRLFDEDTAAELARIAGEQMIDVEPARIPNDERPIGWRFSAGQVVAVPRRDLELFAAAKARLAAARDLAEREAQRERDAATLRSGSPSGPMPSASLANAQAATKRPAHFSGWTEGATSGSAGRSDAEGITALRSAGATWPSQGAS